MNQQLKDLLLPPREAWQIPEAYYGAYLSDSANNLIYYFDKNMKEIGYTTPLSNYLNRSTTGRLWDPEILKKYTIQRTYWTKEIHDKPKL